MSAHKLLREIKTEKDTTSFETLADSLPALVWLSDQTKACIWFNREWLNFTGRTREPEDGPGWTEAIHPDDLSHYLITYNALCDARAPFEIEYRLRHHTGAYRRILDRGNPRYDETGAFVGYSGVCIDITDKINAATVSPAGDERWKILTEAMPQLVWIDRGSDGFCEYLSKQWESYTGLPLDQLLGFGWLTVLHPDDTDRTRHAWQNANEGLTGYEYRIRRFDGTYRWFKVRGVPLQDNDGKILSWYGTCTDIQELVDARDKAEAASIAKTEFLTNMSHEIRTPMNAVIGLSEILARTKPLTEKQQQFIQTLQFSAEALLALINDLLDIAKIEDKNIRIEKIPFRLDELIHEVMSMISLRAQEKNLAFTCDSRKIKDRIFRGDPTRLRQILINLCGNAVKFTEQGGVFIETNCTPPDNKNFAYVSITIRDTGIGIPSEMRAAIFDKFVQADSSINRKYGGTGLGLAITKSLTEIMGGTIELQSEVGIGSTFTIKIPLEITRENF